MNAQTHTAIDLAVVFFFFLLQEIFTNLYRETNVHIWAVLFNWTFFWKKYFQILIETKKFDKINLLMIKRTRTKQLLLH